jgi:hypothetical protein
MFLLIFFVILKFKNFFRCKGTAKRRINKELLEKGCDFNISRQENAYIKGMKIGF